MSVYKYRRVFPAPVGGVNYGVRAPYLIKPGQWLTLQQIRNRLGVVSEFPGWASILASGNAGGFGSLLTEFKLASGTTHIVVGGDDKLFMYDTATSTLTDISGVLTFAPTRDYPWHSIVWNDILYMTNKADGLHKWTGAGNVAAIGGSSPDAWLIRVLRNHLAYFGNGTNPWKFGWAALGSESDWTASATNDAGSFDVIDTNDPAVGLENLDEDLVGYKEKSIHKFTYIGGREVVARRRMVSDVGLLSPYSVAAFTSRHIFMGNPYNFYLYEGSNYVDDSIGDPIREKVFGDFSPLLARRCRSVIWPSTQEVLFFYPSATSSNDCDRCVVYNYKENNWHGPFNIPVTMAGLARVIDAAVIDDIADIIDSVDALIDSFGISSQGYVPLFLDGAGDLHQIGASNSANGVGIERVAETGDIFLGVGSEDYLGNARTFSPSTVFRVNQVNLDFESIVDAEIDLYVGYRMDLNDTIQYAGPYKVKSFFTQNIQVPVRVTGRWFRLKFVLPSSRQMALLVYQFLFNPMGVR